jgi:hypothetical protein
MTGPSDTLGVQGVHGHPLPCAHGACYLEQGRPSFVDHPDPIGEVHAHVLRGRRQNEGVEEEGELFGLRIALLVVHVVLVHFEIVI